MKKLIQFLSAWFISTFNLMIGAAIVTGVVMGFLSTTSGTDAISDWLIARIVFPLAGLLGFMDGVRVFFEAQPSLRLSSLFWELLWRTLLVGAVLLLLSGAIAITTALLLEYIWPSHAARIDAVHKNVLKILFLASGFFGLGASVWMRKRPVAKRAPVRTAKT